MYHWFTLNAVLIVFDSWIEILHYSEDCAQNLVGRVDKTWRQLSSQWRGMKRWEREAMGGLKDLKSMVTMKLYENDEFKTTRLYHGYHIYIHL